MASLNKTMIIGRLGRDPETVYTQSGTAITTITVATSEKWKDKNTGEQKEATEWHRIKFFGKQAETIGKYMSKGSEIYVEGRLQTSQYEKDGIIRYSTEIIANNFQFIGSKNASNQQYQPQNGYQQHGNPGGYSQQSNSGFQQPPQNQNYQQQNYGHGNGQPDDDIPFYCNEV